jgi:hypothetical protein
LGYEGREKMILKDLEHFQCYCNVGMECLNHA